MMEDFEVGNWREQWRGLAQAPPDVDRIRRKIKLQRVRFVIENVLAGMAFIGGLVFAIFVRQQRALLGTGWATGICVLVFLSLTFRLWAQRGAWRADTQSTRAFLELWRRRVQARLRSLRMGTWLSAGWLAFCALLTAANWGTIGPQFKAHPAEWLTPLIVSIVMLPMIFLWVAWLRRRKLAELDEVTKILETIRD